MEVDWLIRSRIGLVLISEVFSLVSVLLGEEGESEVVIP